MANFAILGVSGEAKVWLVDFDTKKGLDFAVLANSRADVASQGYTQA